MGKINVYDKIMI